MSCRIHLSYMIFSFLSLSLSLLCAAGSVLLCSSSFCNRFAVLAQLCYSKRHSWTRVRDDHPPLPCRFVCRHVPRALHPSSRHGTAAALVAPLPPLPAGQVSTSSGISSWLAARCIATGASPPLHRHEQQRRLVARCPKARPGHRHSRLATGASTAPPLAGQRQLTHLI